MIDVRSLSPAEIIGLLHARGGPQQELFQQAREVRAASGVDKVLLRGVIQISNHCQQSCPYCAMRCPAKEAERFRLTPEQILSIVGRIKEAGITVAFLQSGQDPQCDEALEEVIPAIRARYGLGVLLCVGERPAEQYRRYAELGADGFILKFETSAPHLHQQITGRPLASRRNCMDGVRNAGMKLGTGNLTGLPGQTPEILADDFLLALDVAPDYVSTSPFIPHEGTPFAEHPYGEVDTAFNLMALWRIALRTPLIPSVSALEKLRPEGQLMGLNAGANVITINFTPRKSKERFVVSLKHALETIERAGLELASPVAAVTV
jgi:biotin synthase